MEKLYEVVFKECKYPFNTLSYISLGRFESYEEMKQIADKLRESLCLFYFKEGEVYWLCLRCIMDNNFGGEGMKRITVTSEFKNTKTY